MAAAAPGPVGGRAHTSSSSSPMLEDLAGNSVRRVFDRDLTRPEDEPRDVVEPVSVAFRPG